MVLKIDEIDKRLISYIFNNFREPVNKISKKCNISREQTEYRIKKYEREGLIIGYYSLFDLEKLGYIYNYQIKLSLNNLNNIIEDKNIKSDVLILTRLICIGKWNLILTVFSKSKDDVLSLISELFEIYSKDLIDYNLIEPINIRFLPLKIFSKKQTIIFKNKLLPDKDYIIDDVDRKILSVISNSANLKYIDISKKTKVSPEVINYRLKKMIAGNLIEFRIFLNLKKIGYNTSILYLKVNNLNLKNKEKILEFSKLHKSITASAICIGDYNVIYQVVYIDLEELNQIVDEIVAFLKDILINYDLVHIKEELFPCVLPKKI
jgi:DNA-binding Lrp family transcriptional regulator